MQHTPGPWTVDSDDGIDFTIIGGKTFQVRIAVEASERDARLIAAAPAMLAALQELIAEWDARHADEDHRTGYTLDTAGVAMARAAIARAS